MGVAEMALAAQVGQSHRVLQACASARGCARYWRRSCGDVAAKPGSMQIRKMAMAWRLEALVESGRRSEAVSLGNAADELNDLRRRIGRGLLEADLLVISGGVSKGKYDLVETVLAELGAEFFFDAVAIRPGQPAVFGCCKGKLVLGLPGNPVSSMVTFELFAQPVMDILSGAVPQPLLMLKARLAHPVRESGNSLTRFRPALVALRDGDPEVVGAALAGVGGFGGAGAR